MLRPLPAAAEAGYDAEQRGTRRIGPLETAPLVVLAAGAAVLGVQALPPVARIYRDALGVPGEAVPEPGQFALSGSLAVVAVAVALRWPALPAPALARSWLGLGTATRVLVVGPVLALARALATFDDRVIDAAVHGTARRTAALATSLRRFDDAGIDGAVGDLARGIRRLGDLARGIRRLGDLARRPQTGKLYQYYAQAVTALAAAVLILLLVR